MAKQSNHRVTIEEVKAGIKKATYTVLPSGRTTVCELTLTNGLTVLGTSTVLDIANFKAKLGKEAAYRNAEDGVWEILGVIKQQAKFEADRGYAAAVPKPKVAAKKAPTKRTIATRALKAGELMTQTDVRSGKRAVKKAAPTKHTVTPKKAEPKPIKGAGDDGSWPFPTAKLPQRGLI